LRDAAELTGVPGPTISRIETSKMAPTFAIVARITVGLGFEVSDLALDDAPKKDRVLKGDPISVSRSHDQLDLPGITYHLMHAGSVLARSLGTFLSDVTARSAEEMGGLAGHEGVEFCYVLDGALELQFEGRPSEILLSGQSALFDAQTPHAYVVHKGSTVRILTAITHPGREETELNFRARGASAPVASPRRQSARSKR
jgi:transcriptional regulator with XRE-family HTH domain